jgi:aconitate hydratase
MTPRYLGCAAVIAKSFARIHETNLKKQGVLALTSADPFDYSKIMEDDRISIVGLNNLRSLSIVSCITSTEERKKYLCNILIMNLSSSGFRT